jgi:glycine/D-amino acid oxidase-like deaminating enzyme
MFDSDLIEAVVAVEECAFDASKLRTMTEKSLVDAGVTFHTGTAVMKIERGAHALELSCASSISSPEASVGSDPVEIAAKCLLNCTYSGINQVLQSASLPLIRLKHEVTEMALVRVPEELERMAFTVMCGPFFSFMPFPALGLHTLSHVRYTPHGFWFDEPGSIPIDPDAVLKGYGKVSKFEHMRRDARRYLPIMGSLERMDSIWETKTVLPQSEADDSRPILCRQADGEARIWSIMGGKIDNIFDAIDQFTATPTTCS